MSVGVLASSERCGVVVLGMCVGMCVELLLFSLVSPFHQPLPGPRTSLSALAHFRQPSRAAAVAEDQHLPDGV
jgi:hypothetical protein